MEFEIIVENGFVKSWENIDMTTKVNKGSTASFDTENERLKMICAVKE